MANRAPSESMAKPRTTSPLADAPAVQSGTGAAAFQMSEIFPLGRLLIRGQAEDATFAAAVQNALALSNEAGEGLPATNQSRAGKNGSILLGLGPNEWMLWIDDAHTAATHAALSSALAGTHAALVDVSDYYTTIRMVGAPATEILAGGCPFPCGNLSVGGCVQTHYEHANILVYRAADNKAGQLVFDVQVRWSFAAYLHHHIRLAY